LKTNADLKFKESKFKSFRSTIIWLKIHFSVLATLKKKNKDNIK